MSHAARVAFGVLFFVGCTNACFAQAEPPQSAPLAGRAAPISPSAGCDVGQGGGLYGTLGGNVSAAGNVTGAQNAGPAANPNVGANVPLYGTDLDGNLPLYSTPDLGGNFPLYSTPVAGTNAPLYSNSTLNTAPLGSISSAVNSGSTRCHSGIPVGEWLLYPSLRAYSLYSNNLFLTPTAPIKVVGFGATPAFAAEWSNGIHSTSISGHFDTQYYPTDNAIDTLDGKATIIQRYSPIPDLSFSMVGDYTHQTISSALTNSLPTSVNPSPAAPTLLPSGNILLPNGNIVTPTGQIVGNINPALAFNGTNVVDPYNQYTASAAVTKIFNGGILTLGSSFATTDYQQLQGTGPSAFTSFTTESFNENSSFAIGPLFYVYSNGDFSLRNENASMNPNSNAYEVKGGIGTRQFGLFRSSAYFGYQGSEQEGSGTAGGTLYGGSVSYFPTYVWTIIARVDHTNNISSETTVSTQALTLPTSSPVQIPVSSASRITTPSLQTTYQITPLWTVLGNFSYTHIENIGSPILTNAWLASATLSYEIWRNMSLSAQYQFTDVVSNAPGQSAMRSMVTVATDYRF